jgi:molybdopterin synthase catalytic subunit/molybdopterin converting factor small subunit
MSAAARAALGTGPVARGPLYDGPDDRIGGGAAVKVRVRMFGALAAKSGAGEEYLELPEGSTAADAIALVAHRYPDAAPVLERVTVAVNLETESRDHRLSDGDEVALLPPVAGGSGEAGATGRSGGAGDPGGRNPAARITTGVRSDAISVDDVMALVASPDAGGTVVFVGTVRSNSEDWGDVSRLDYSIYREMAEPMLHRVAEEAAARWPLNGVCILHRVGQLSVGEQTVVVACSAPHRQEAFEAARYGIDEVKRRVPVWKEEVGPDGRRWIGIDEPAEHGGTAGGGAGDPSTSAPAAPGARSPGAVVGR